MRRHWKISFILCCAALVAGCRGRSDLVEAELRYKERELRELSAERARLAELNSAYENSLRGPANCPPGVGHGGNVQHHVKDVQVARGTGGLDEDKCPGDEGLLVVIAPRDVDDSIIKATGQARVTALQLTPEGLKLPLSTWDVSSTYLRRNWKTGLLSSGYYVPLPWQVVPQSDRLRVVVQFQTPDGAFFEAERDVQVRLPHAPPAGTNMPAGVTPPPIPAINYDGPMPPLPTGPAVFPSQPPPAPLPFPTPEGPSVNSASFKHNLDLLPARLWRPTPRAPVELGPLQP
jgi:hypothetical protein